MTQEQITQSVKEIEDFVAKYEDIWQKMSNVRKPEEKASYMVSKEEFIGDFVKLVGINKDADNAKDVLLALGNAAAIIFKYSGQACLATGTKDGLTQIGIEEEYVADLGKFYLQSEEAKK
ncbi:MAG: hypothetical protein Q4E99_03320 [Bacillota bacterium]|nr:hypothetical protein [Bacillota bacterium]